MILSFFSLQRYDIKLSSLDFVGFWVSFLNFVSSEINNFILFKWSSLLMITTSFPLSGFVIIMMSSFRKSVSASHSSLLRLDVFLRF